jgi:membrane protease YdiL (CAAX protease family)
MAKAKAKTKVAAKPRPPAYDPDSYWQQSQQPLQILFFMLPVMFLYEMGLLLYIRTLSSGARQDIYARSLLFQLFDWFGIEGYYWPPLIVVTVLLTWHILKKDPWRIQPRTCAWMWLESTMLAIPLFIFALVLFRQPVTQTACETHHALTSAATPRSLASIQPARHLTTGWQTQLVFSIGAGIYEELVFRLMAIAILHALLVDLLALPEKTGAIGAIAISAIAFAVYHFSPHNPFTIGKFLFYTGAGVYFAVVYVLRGFGIVAGTHALYDALVVFMEFSSRA